MRWCILRSIFLCMLGSPVSIGSTKREFVRDYSKNQSINGLQFANMKMQFSVQSNQFRLIYFNLPINTFKIT